MLTACVLSSCAGISERSLYDDLGGQPVVTAFVDDFANRVHSNPRISQFFADSDMDRFRDKLHEFICEISAGPCRYTGDAMPPVHLGLGINDAHFNSLVSDLIDAMEAQRVPVGAQNRLLAILAPLHPDIVDPPP